MSEFFDIVADQGATFALALLWRDDAGVPIDVSTASADMQVRTAIDATPIVIEFSSATGGIVLQPGSSEPFVPNIAISATAPVMAALEPGVYVYDLQITIGAEVTTLMSGSFTITAEVTK